MQRNRRKFIIIISIVSLAAVLCGTIAVASLTGSSAATLGQQEPEKDGDVKYEKPAVGDIAQDGSYPDELKSSSSANAQEKQWYEYVTYSKTALEPEVQIGDVKYVFYEPYDYNYGMVMKVTNTIDDFGMFYDSEGYTTANEIKVSYAFSKSKSWANTTSLTIGFEEEGGASIPFIANATVKMSQIFGFTGGETDESGSSSAKEVTYNAIYFNSNGTPYRWRVVKYTVYLPLYCEIFTLVNGEWILAETNYCLLATVTGTCREWINNVTYIEDWRTGEPITVEDFWGKYRDEEKLKNAYLYHMIPQN